MCVRRGALRLSHRAWRFGAAPGSQGSTSLVPTYDMAAQATPSGHMGVSVNGAPYVFVPVMRWRWAVALEGQPEAHVRK